MPRTRDEQAVIDRFSKIYEFGQSDFMLDIERSVCGCDYGGTSWTTHQEALNVCEMLNLGPHQRLLDVGAGSGWPGLYIAKETGCDITLIDLPLEGLRIAKNRAASDQLAGTYWIALADGAALPFRDGWFDAIYHSDVLCCLVEKLGVLKSCRRAVRAGGQMVFSVIYITPELSAAGYELAKAGGPPFVETADTYPDMLREGGWEIKDRVDLTDEYLDSTRLHVLGQEAHANEIANAFGNDEASEMLTRRRATVSALEDGLLRRELFDAVPVGVES